MDALFISFTRLMNSENKNWDDYYRDSLQDQFKALQLRVPLDRRTNDFQEFFEAMFTSGLRKRYYFSCPNFLRDRPTDASGKTVFLKNVIIKPELTLSMKRYLPDGQNIILIGDIAERQDRSEFNVKGMQFIDDTMSSSGDMKVYAMAINAFHLTEINTKAGTTIKVPEWNYAQWRECTSFLTPDFIKDLINHCFTVSNPLQVRKTYDEWRRYMNFRKYYLGEQAKRSFKLDRVSFLDSYAVNKKEFRRSQSVYEGYILDGISDFTKGEMIVLSERVESAEPFPLIRLDIDRNKKQFMEARVQKGSKLVNEELLKIRSLAGDNVFITTGDPATLNDEKAPWAFANLLRSGFELGDRFRTVTVDIEPTEHIHQIEFDRDRAFEVACDEIDARYQRIIDRELDEMCKVFEAGITKRILETVGLKEASLEERLEHDVSENNDPTVLAAIKEEKRRIARENPQGKKESDQDYQARLKSLYEDIDIAELYRERNQRLLDELKRKEIEAGKRELERYRKTTSGELQVKYRDDIRKEKIDAKARLDAECEEKCRTVIDEETIYRISIYFRLPEGMLDVKKETISLIESCGHIVYDSRAEKAKLKRQEMALEAFYSGYVKNPYLSTYLFDPNGLEDPSQQLDADWTWFLESLNEKQKEAVRKAVYSNGIFLLQGPPGTGKTQVIAETVAQLVKKGKRVLISSETHKAIDNVFERLPKTAEIVPIRLIPTRGGRKRENGYEPQFLVDNFYKNISDAMRRAVTRYQNFQRNKEEFEEEFGKLKTLKSKIERRQSLWDEAQRQIGALEQDAKALNTQRSSKKDILDNLKIELDLIRRTRRRIEKNRINIDDDIDQALLGKFLALINGVFVGDMFCTTDLPELLSAIESIDMAIVRRELTLLDPESSAALLEVRKLELRRQISACRDELDEIIPGREEEYERLKKELGAIVNQQNTMKADGATNLDLQLRKIFDYAYLTQHTSEIEELLEGLKDKLAEAKASFFDNEIDPKATLIEGKIEAVEGEIKDLAGQIKGINEKIAEIQDQDDVKEIQESRAKLIEAIGKFFRDFEIATPYDSIESAIRIIESKWQSMQSDFASQEAENQAKIPMYRRIVEYISSAEVIEEDRRLYTKELFESANVFGITCTSSDRFGQNNLDTLSDYGIEGIDIKSAGIDVVIIDEVSKSSFIDLLIPILYGKTVILVGDHRQLPPMYEFAKLRADDFEGLNPSIINEEINKEFTRLCEECFFKTLFERIPDAFKTMLVQQYRCHEDIMRVFNHFYQGQLRLGWPGQNNAKNHGIRIVSNGRVIIEPDKHVYFVDCKGFETHQQDSTSMYNSGEAEVVAELVRKINTYLKEHPREEADKLSIGIICTYGDQARRIKELMRKVKIDGFKTDVEKMIVSTVDDFQGDERDIIILSTVRNPEKPERSNPGFILAYQRINVALSRARRLLIVVGNKKYLETKGVIDLPDVNGNPAFDRKHFRVYEEIIGTIESYGKSIDDVDVLENKGGVING